MIEALTRKLAFGADLTQADIKMLSAACAYTRVIPAHTEVISEGDTPGPLHVVLDGFACRYKQLPNGRKQIVALFVPGDFCDLNVHILGEMDHSIASITEATIAFVSPGQVADLTRNPRINLALWWATLVEAGTLREWLVNMGQRASDAQMAHIFCELSARLRAVGLVEDGQFAFPLTQQELSEMMGITVVHTNRTLSKLKDAGLVRVESRRIVVPDLERLEEFAGFNPNYLHMTDRRRPRRLEVLPSPDP